MKWINLVDSFPDKEDAVIRDIKSKVCLDWMYIRKITKEFITYDEGEFGNDYPSIEYEWLDEEIKEGRMLIEVPVGSFIITPDKIGYPRYIQSEVDKLLVEQHHNTKHDAAEAVMGYIVDTDCFLDSSPIHSLIMNLEQRKP